MARKRLQLLSTADARPAVTQIRRPCSDWRTTTRIEQIDKLGTMTTLDPMNPDEYEQLVTELDDLVERSVDASHIAMPALRETHLSRHFRQFVGANRPVDLAELQRIAQRARRAV